jgi:hypothetical protein
MKKIIVIIIVSDRNVSQKLSFDVQSTHLKSKDGGGVLNLGAQLTLIQGAVHPCDLWSNSPKIQGEHNEHKAKDVEQ